MLFSIYQKKSWKAAQLFSTLIINYKKLFCEQQISILEQFLKDHVTPKTGEMILKIQYIITGINDNITGFIIFVIK